MARVQEGGSWVLETQTLAAVCSGETKRGNGKGNSLKHSRCAYQWPGSKRAIRSKRVAWKGLWDTEAYGCAGKNMDPACKRSTGREREIIR
eukprot:1157659-Pelagomonas_calceolata.AAC.7